MSPPRRAPLAGLAFAAVVLGHGVTYALVAGPHGAPSLLARTGHGYWSAAVALGAAAAVLGFATLIVRRFAARHEDALGSPRSILLRLIVLQLTMFGGIEAGERIAAGFPVSSVFDQNILFLGAAIQAIIAAATTLLIRGVRRAAAFAHASGRTREDVPASPLVLRLASVVHARRSRLLRSGSGVRAPPATA